MTHVFNIDIDSSYRDRLTYPDCGNFVVPLNTKQPQIINGFNAADPVILGFPYDTGIYTSTGSVTDPFGLFPPLTALKLTLGASSSNQVDFYVGNCIQIPSIDYYGTIILYNESTKEVLCYPNAPAPPASFTGFTGSYYTIRPEFPQKINNNYVNTLPVNAPSELKINLGAAVGSTLTKEYIVGKYIYVQPPITIFPWFNLEFPNQPVSEQVKYTFQWSLIIDFNPLTNIITVQKPFLAPLPAGTKYEILTFSYDHAQPLNYAGTDIFSNPRCSTVNLVNCIIPNYIPLANRNGGYITDYPYVFIALYTEGNRTYNQPFMSMSPFSDRALFKVPISPNSDAFTTQFLTLNSGITSQNVYFKHNDNFRFEIFLPNGEPIRFNPALFNFKTGTFTYFLGLGFPVPADPKANVQATFRVSFN
jgi:hypothetical protein